MAQSDQTVQNATFPTVRADINDNLAALFSQSSGPSAPATTVAFQPWVDTSSTPAVWKVRNASNNGWITVGVLDPAGFRTGGVTPIANGGTGQITAAAALAALLPSQAGQSGKALISSAGVAAWGTVAAGASLQLFISSGSYTPTAGKTTFLVFATGGGGGGGGSSASGILAGGGGAGGTGLRLYNSTEMGSQATITIGGGGGGGGPSNGTGGTGGNTVFTPSGTGLVLTGIGGTGGTGGSGAGGFGGDATNAQISMPGLYGSVAANTFRRTATVAATQNGGGAPGWSFWQAGFGYGGFGANWNSGSAGTAGVVLILEW